MTALNPCHLSAVERRRELCAILAEALLRLRMGQSSEEIDDPRESSLHNPPHQSGHAPTQTRRTT